MRRLLCLVVAVLAWTGSAAHAAGSAGFAGAAAVAAPAPNARAFYVVNASNGEVLAAHDAHVALPIASITKLMTVLVALQHLKPDETVTITGSAAQVGESRIPLVAGQRVTVRDLLKGALIQSANNAADALAAAASGGNVPRFVAWMNARAHAIGLHHTHFVRPDGLDAPDHVSSARDVAVLAQVAMHEPIVRSLVRERTDTIEGGRFAVHTWNDLLGVVPGMIGVKTGHTSDSGWCQVAAVRRNGYTIYAVILGSPTRAQRNADLEQLLMWGVAQYHTATLVRRASYAQVELGWGRSTVALVPSKPLVRVVRAGKPLVERVIAPSAVSLPLVRGQRLGRVEIWDGKTLIGTRPLLAARSVSRPGFGGRLRWYATRTGHHLLGFFS